LKANASSLLGTLYEKGDARCDGGFTLFYLGFNLGAFIGPLITGLLQTRAGFHYGFGAAAVGMHWASPSTSRSGATWVRMAG
jgi:proton-dependent oligopeptide transporter, POT family